MTPSYFKIPGKNLNNSFKEIFVFKILRIGGNILLKMTLYQWVRRITVGVGQ